jgi:hypothetical protein
MRLHGFSEDRCLSVIHEQSPLSAAESLQCNENHATNCEDDEEDHADLICDLSETAGSAFSESEDDDLLSSRSRVHIDITTLVHEDDGADNEEEDCYTRDAASDLQLPPDGGYGPSPILMRRGAGALVLKTALRDELRHITDSTNDFEKCLELQGGVLTNRQRRWLGLQQDEDLCTLKRFSSPLRVSRKEGMYLGGQGKGESWRRRPMWIPLSVMVAGAESCAAATSHALIECLYGSPSSLRIAPHGPLGQGSQRAAPRAL